MSRNLYKLTKVLITSSSFQFYEVIILLTAKKVEGFRGFLLNISKTVQLIFTKLISLLGNIYSIFWNLKIEHRSFLVAMVTNS